MNDRLESEIVSRIGGLTDEELIQMIEDSENYSIEGLRIAGDEMMKRGIGTACINHPTAVAIVKCHNCEIPLCETCMFPTSESGRLCPTCVTGGSPVEEEPEDTTSISEYLEGKTCVNHPESQAVVFCKLCGAPVCGTCDFVFAGNVHVCPACTERPRNQLSAKRKKNLTWSYILAAWSTIWLIVMLSGVFAESVSSEEELEAFGMVIGSFILIPAIIGTALGVGGLDRRLSRPPVVWGAAIWNGIILGIYILLMIIGIFMG
jgi:hypothetical protein